MIPSQHEVVRQLTPETLLLVRARIGGGPETWSVDEIGDGNVNLIFRLCGPEGQVLIKQAVPYLRCVGESWPLSLRRNFFEFSALREHASVAGAHVPEVFALDEKSSAMVMEFLGDHIILRKGMIQGRRYPYLVAHITDYMANTLFFTSDLFLAAEKKKEKMKLYCDNVDLCKITEDLIFTDPYREAKTNRWTSPQLDPIAQEFARDVRLKIAITGLKAKFLTSAEALIHGDLHSGSIMVNERETKVIDPEFAFYGPMGFDPGLLLANFLLAYFSQAGLGSHDRDRQAYEDWILEVIRETWSAFAKKFTSLWETNLRGDYLPPQLMARPEDREAVTAVRNAYMRRLFEDTVGFAAAEMIRRILGLAHVADMESIADVDQRATCERRALETARQLLVNAAAFAGIDEVLELAQKTRLRQIRLDS